MAFLKFPVLPNQRIVGIPPGNTDKHFSPLTEIWEALYERATLARTATIDLGGDFNYKYDNYLLPFRNCIYEDGLQAKRFTARYDEDEEEPCQMAFSGILEWFMRWIVHRGGVQNSGLANYFRKPPDCGINDYMGFVMSWNWVKEDPDYEEIWTGGPALGYWDFSKWRRITTNWFNGMKAYLNIYRYPTQGVGFNPCCPNAYPFEV